MEQFESEYSSNIGWARYHEATRVLEVDFKDKHGNKSSTYTYQEFPASEWAEFREAASKGKFFAERIRPRYVGARQGEKAKPEAAPVLPKPTTGNLF
jgi:hypothetical protein